MPRLEHVQLCHPGGPRAGSRQLGVAASVQPVHLREDADDRAPRLGRPRRGERLHVAQPARCRRRGRVRHGRAGRADRSLARHRDGRAPARPVVGPRRRALRAGRDRSPSSRRFAPRRSGRTRPRRTRSAAGSCPAPDADLIVLPAAPRERAAPTSRPHSAPPPSPRSGRGW